MAANKENEMKKTFESRKHNVNYLITIQSATPN